MELNESEVCSSFCVFCDHLEKSLMCFGVILESKFSPFVDVSHPDSLESQSIRNRFVTLSRLIVTELASQKKKKKK